MTVPNFAAWAAAAAVAALLVGALRGVNDRAAWLLAVILLLGVVISSRERVQALNDFIAILSGARPKPGLPSR